MNDEGNNIVIERVILINSENNFTNDCAITDNDQKKLSYMTSMLLDLLTSKPEYKNAFPMAEWEL